MICRGSTPTIEFELLDCENQPFDIEMISKVVITFSQFNSIVIEKTYERADITSNKIDVYLTQEDTLALTTNTQVEMQAELLLTSGDVVITDIIKRSVRRTLNEVIFE